MKWKAALIDSMASNYNPYANVDNGSCEYPTEGCTNPWRMQLRPDCSVGRRFL